MGERLVVRFDPDTMAQLRALAQAHGTDPKTEVERLLDMALKKAAREQQTSCDAPQGLTAIADEPSDGEGSFGTTPPQSQ